MARPRRTVAVDASADGPCPVQGPPRLPRAAGSTEAGSATEASIEQVVTYLEHAAPGPDDKKSKLHLPRRATAWAWPRAPDAICYPACLDRAQLSPAPRAALQDAPLSAMQRLDNSRGRWPAFAPHQRLIPCRRSVDTFQPLVRCERSTSQGGSLSSFSQRRTVSLHTPRRFINSRRKMTRSSGSTTNGSRPAS